MNPRLRAAQDRLEALQREGDALLAKDSLTAEEQERFDALVGTDESPGQLAVAKEDVERAKKLSGLTAESREYLNGFRGGSVASGLDLNHLGARTTPDAEAEFEALKQVRTHARYFSLTSDSRKAANLKAYRFGMYILASITGNAKAVNFCRENGIPLAMGFSASGGHTESINELGGALVPAEFESDLIDLRERFGLFRTWARYTPMTSDTKSRPRRRGGLTAYFVGGGQDGTRSKGAWDRVKLVAKKAMVLALYESELNEDSIIDIGDTFAGEIAYAFAKLEDQCGFIGDGTSTYGDIVGVTEKLKGLDNTVANIAGLQVASGNAWSEIALTDFNFLVGRLPEYADTPNTAWFCHKAFYHGVMEKLMLAAGGVTAQEVAAGRRNPVFMGYPVRITQAMPKIEANSQIPCLFGDLALSAMFGDRRGTTIALSEHAEFESDELLIRGTERFDINVHDVGNASATAAQREAGPMVGLITAAS